MSYMTLLLSQSGSSIESFVASRRHIMFLEDLKKLVENKEMMEIARLAIEKELLEYRDLRISQPMRGNGLVIKEKDGAPSDVIRLGPEQALKIGLNAIIKYIEE